MMHRRRSPVVIMFDVLFIFLFATLTESSPNIEILYLGQKPTNNIGFYLYDDNGQGLYLLENGLFQESQAGMDFYSTFNCDGQTSCASNTRNGFGIELILYGKAMHIVSSVTTMVCIEQPEQCGRLKFVFDGSGKLDLDRLIRDNPGVKNIRGFAAISI